MLLDFVEGVEVLIELHLLLLSETPAQAIHVGEEEVDDRLAAPAAAFGFRARRGILAHDEAGEIDDFTRTLEQSWITILIHGLAKTYNACRRLVCWLARFRRFDRQWRGIQLTLRGCRAEDLRESQAATDAGRAFQCCRRPVRPRRVAGFDRLLRPIGD